jgi:uncharacterized protein with PQ loop repeat
MLAWIGTISSIIGSFMVATGITLMGYYFFTVGSFCWLMVAYKRKDKALGMLNGTFFVANIIGLFNYW